MDIVAIYCLRWTQKEFWIQEQASNGENTKDVQGWKTLLTLKRYPTQSGRQDRPCWSGVCYRNSNNRTNIKLSNKTMGYKCTPTNWMRSRHKKILFHSPEKPPLPNLLRHENNINRTGQGTPSSTPKHAPRQRGGSHSLWSVKLKIKIFRGKKLGIQYQLIWRSPWWNTQILRTTYKGSMAPPN